MSGAAPPQEANAKAELNDLILGRKVRERGFVNEKSGASSSGGADGRGQSLTFPLRQQSWEVSPAPRYVGVLRGWEGVGSGEIFHGSFHELPRKTQVVQETARAAARINSANAWGFELSVHSFMSGCFGPNICSTAERTFPLLCNFLPTSSV